MKKNENISKYSTLYFTSRQPFCFILGNNQFLKIT